MNTINILFTIILINICYGKIIHKNILCKNCKYFLRTNNECALFSKENLINGNIKYESAYDCRNLDTMCSKDAIYFEKNTNQLITNFYYYFFQNKNLLFLLVVSLILYNKLLIIW